MGRMTPVAEHMVAYHVDTNAGTEIIPESVCGVLSNDACLTPFESVETLVKLEPYLESSTIHSVERREGWYGRLSASGYLDCIPWDGPYDTAGEALASVKETFDCDDNGDDLPEDGT